MSRHLSLIVIACALGLAACAKQTPPAANASSTGGEAQNQALPEPTDNSALDESDETPKQPDEVTRP